MTVCSRTRLGEPYLRTYPVESVDLLRRARIAFQAGRTLTEGFRLAQLEALVRMLEEHECDFVDALGRDLHKVRTDFSSIILCHCSVSVMFPCIFLFSISRDLKQLCLNWSRSRMRLFMPSATCRSGCSHSLWKRTWLDCSLFYKITWLGLLERKKKPVRLLQRHALCSAD